MTSTELPWQVWGRKIRPYALAVSLASAVVAWAILVKHNDAWAILVKHNDAGSHLESGSGVLVGWAAAAAVLLLWWGWWAQSDRTMRAGLLLTAGVFAARAAIVWLDQGTVGAAWLLSVAWCVASGGAWLLERSAR